MRWKGTSTASLKFNLFGRWRRKSVPSNEEDIGDKTSRKGKLLAFLVPRKNSSRRKTRKQLTESEEDLKAWMEMRQEKSSRRQRTSQEPQKNNCTGNLFQSQIETQQASSLVSRRINTMGAPIVSNQAEEDKAWKERLLRQESDIEHLTNLVNQLKSQLGKKNLECSELRREVDRLDSIKKSNRNRNSMNLQDESFQTVIFPVQSNRRSTITSRRMADSLATSFTSLKKRHMSTQTEQFGENSDLCSNENCKIQLMKLRRESNSLKMQLAEGEDIILGLELDHDALRKYLTQTELKLEKAEDELVTVRRHLEEKEHHYKRSLSSYEDSLNVLKEQNDKLSGKLLAVMNKVARFPPESCTDKKDVGIQVISQLTFPDNTELDVPSYGQAVKLRRMRQQNTPQTVYINKNERDKISSKKYQNSSFKGLKLSSNSFYQPRESGFPPGTRHDQHCASSDTSLEYEIKRRNRVFRKAETFEREDSGLETDRSCISADNDNDCKGEMNIREVNNIATYNQQLRHGIDSEESVLLQRLVVGENKDRKELENNWQGNMFLHTSHFDSNNGENAISCQGRPAQLERPRTVVEESDRGQSNHNYRQSWHELSTRHYEMVRGIPPRSDEKSYLPCGSRYESTVETDNDPGEYVYFR